MATCIWTNERCSNVQTITVEAPDRLGRNPSPETVAVCPEHEDDVRAYIARVRRHGTMMILLLFVLTLVMVGASLLPTIGATEAVLPVTGVGCALMGSVIYVFPFSTPETIDMLGIQRSVSITQWVALALVVVGLGVFGVGFA